MQMIQGKCLGEAIRIHEDREVVQCDERAGHRSWQPGEGYFLVRLHEGQICAGYVDGCHEMKLEFRGTDPDHMTAEIVRRDFVSPDHLAYIAGELLLAKQCLDQGREYSQR